jgi:hypothetical protein
MTSFTGGVSGIVPNFVAKNTKAARPPPSVSIPTPKNCPNGMSAWHETYSIVSRTNTPVLRETIWGNDWTSHEVTLGERISSGPNLSGEKARFIQI